MKLALLLAAVIAVVLAFGTARAVEDPPEPHLQLVEVEQMTPYLESSLLAATSQTQSRIVRQSGGTFSSQAYALFDNHNGDGSRATFPLEVDEADTYGISAVFARGPGYGIVQVAIDGRPVGAPFDGYAAAAGQAPAVALGTVALAEGKHMLSMTVTGRNAAATDWLAGLDLLVLDSEAAAQPTPTAVATTEVGGTVPPTLSLTLGAPARFENFQPGVEREYTASTTANVISSAGDAALTTSEPGHLQNGSFTLPQSLRVRVEPASWSGPVSNARVTLTFMQKIGETDALRTGAYTKTLTFTLSTTRP